MKVIRTHFKWIAKLFHAKIPEMNCVYQMENPNEYLCVKCVSHTRFFHFSFFFTCMRFVASECQTTRFIHVYSDLSTALDTISYRC